MGFSRFFSLFLFCLIIVSCHEEKKNANINVQLDDLADWNIREYSLSSRKIRHEIDSLRLLPLRMYADEYTRKYYASSAPFLWITRSGIDEKADTLLAYNSKRLLRPVYGKVIFIYPSFKQTCDESVNWISTPKTTSMPFSDALSFYLRKLISDTYADNASDTSNRTRYSIG